MSSILSAQNLQTLRRRKSVRRWPCALSPPFLSPPRPRPPPPVRPCPNATSDPLVRPDFEPRIDRVLVLGLARAALARLALRRQPALDAPPLRVGLPLRARPLDDLLLLIDADDEMADDLIHHAQPSIELLHQVARSVDHLQDVDAFLVVPDLVGQ